MTIAVDFDGTIVEHRYPRIGEEIPFAVETLKLLQQEKQMCIRDSSLPVGQIFVLCRQNKPLKHLLWITLLKITKLNAN